MPNRHENLTSLFSDIAASIKAKTGSSDAIVADNFDTAIDAIITDPTTDATINSNSQLLNGVTAYGKGVKYTGNIPSRSKSDITVAANTATIPSGHYANSATVTASELVAGNKSLASSGSAQTGIDVTNYATVSISGMPVSALDSSIIAGEAFEEATGDYAWKSTVSIPTGYHTAQTIEKTFSDVFPAPASEGTADKMRLGYQLYNHEGKLITGTMPNESPAFDGGALSEGGAIGSVTTTPVVTPAISGSVTSITTTTKPSGTDGTNYWTLDPSGSVTTTGKVTGSKTITRAAVLYNGAVKGYVEKADDTVALASDSVGKTVSVNTDVTPSVAAGTNRYIVAGSQGTPTATKSISGNTATITPSATDTTGYIVGATKTGSAVTVTAAEVTSGNKAITATTGTQTGIDVVNYATVSVAPTPSETKTATPTVNGFDVNPTSGKLLSKVTVAAIPVTQTENAQGGITYTIAGV